MLNVFQIGILLRGAMESPTSFLKVLAELILLSVLGHLRAHDDDLKRPNIMNEIHVQ